MCNSDEFSTGELSSESTECILCATDNTCSVHVFFLAALSLCSYARAFSSCSEWASQCSGLSCSRTQALEQVALAAWCTGSSALWPVESSRIRDRTHVPGIGRWIRYHWTTREVLFHALYTTNSSSNPLTWVLLFFKPTDEETEAHRGYLA